MIDEQIQADTDEVIVPAVEPEAAETPAEEPKDENPYEARLKALEAEKAKLEADMLKKDDIIARKEEVIRKTAKKVEAPTEFEDRFKALEERLINKEVKEHLNQLTQDPHEQELAMRMYNSRIVKTGNVAEDVRAALGVANVDVLLKSRQQLAEQEAFESSLASRASTHVQGSPGNRSMKSPAMKMAEDLLSKIDPEAKKHLGKYLT